MMNKLNSIRRPNRITAFPKAVLHTTVIAVAGVLLGVASKLLDIYSSVLGDIFSQMSVWIFMCTMISVLSSTPLRAAVNVFALCVGMLPAYYLTAEFTSSVYSMSFVYGWTVFALLTPILAFCAWYAKGSKLISRLIGVGVIIVMLVAAAVLFDKIRISDIIFAVLTGVVLFKKQSLRTDNPRQD